MALYVRRILAGSCLLLMRCTEREGMCLYIAATGGITAQICALAQMLIDPYFRTIDGFRVLIEKDWLAAGHQFQKRIGHGLSPDDEAVHKDHQFFYGSLIVYISSFDSIQHV